MSFRPIRFIKNLLNANKNSYEFPADYEEFHKEIINKVRPYTMTSPERLFALIEAVKYCIQNQIPGDFVECGVWKGGSMMAIAETLIRLGVTDRQLWLFDTYAGMTEPTAIDIAQNDEIASDLLIKEVNQKSESIIWAFSTIEEVKKNVSIINYPVENIHFVEGDVLDTIPDNSPAKIALLRLDTDWYESTKHELLFLYPNLTKNGILIIDDYGYWRGSRQAVDEYITEKKLCIFLSRIDDTGRIATKIN
jgi:hypothetical protein